MNIEALKFTIMKKYFFILALLISVKSFCQPADSTRYRYYLGTNFDFIDGLEAKNLYHHVNITLPKAFSNKFGFVGGIYQTKQVSTTDTVNYLTRGKTLRESLTFPSNDTGFIKIVTVDSANLIKTSSTKALGVYLQPTFLLTDSNRNTRLFAIGHLEYTKRNIEEKYSLNYKIRDTLSIPKNNLSTYQPLPSERKYKKSQDEGYFGVGLMIHHQDRFVEILAKGVLGLASLDKLYPFYAIDVSLMVLKGNFELGVSYKGLLPNYPPYFLNVHLSKTFYLDKIGELLQ